jgi:putative SOS response-associated peptidase YedK
MCRRFSRQYTWSQARAFLSMFSLDAPDEDRIPAYNVAPTQSSWAITPQGDHGLADERIWELIPQWPTKANLASSTFTARLKSIADKPAIRGTWEAGRRTAR